LDGLDAKPPTLDGLDAKPPTPAQLLGIAKRQGFRCAYTGRKLTPGIACWIWHVPLGKGGEPAVDNVRLVVREVAKMKDGLAPEEFVAWCRDVASAATA
jgi:hypothetical protein